MEPRWVDDPAALREVVDAVAGAAEYAIDTEFLRERSYFAQLALLQVAWSGGVALIDPLAVDVAPLGEILHGPGLAVMHAGDQDLEILERACGAVPERFVDTQVAAGFLGLSSPSLGSLLDRFLGLRLPKGDRLTDWTRRPLTKDQLDYAAADVAHLLDVLAVLRAQLEERGRWEWAVQECERVLQRSRAPQDPETAWWRLKDSRALRGRGRGVAQELAAWRERRAAELDVPTRFVLSDLALVSIAHRPPRNRDELREVRGLDQRSLKGTVVDDVLEAIKRGQSLPDADVRLPPVGDVERDQRAALALVSAWVSQLARDLHIETALLATRADLAAFLAGEADCRLAQGWRAALVGEPVRLLVDGGAALAFDGEGELVLEERSRRLVAGPAEASV